MSVKVSEMQTLNDTEIKMRLKNVFVTFLPWAGSLQWTVHENKALYSYPGRVYSIIFTLKALHSIELSTYQLKKTPGQP